MSMQFPFGETVYRDRAPQKPDPYRPGHFVPGDFDDPAADVLRIDNAFVASSSSSGTGDASRTQVLTAKSLYCSPDVDVRVGDRIRAGGAVYFVNAVPAADTNPFTGWRPAQEIPLDNTLG